MKKIKLKQEYVDALDYAPKKSEEYRDSPELLILDAEEFSTTDIDDCFGGEMFPLNYLKIWAIAKAVYRGYEVKEDV